MCHVLSLQCRYSRLIVSTAAHSPGRAQLAAGKRAQKANYRYSIVAKVTEEILEWDIVEYSLPKALGDAKLGLGRVIEVNKDSFKMELLVEEEEGIWVQDDAHPSHPVPADKVLRVITADYGQRMDTNRIANPHGEHAHDIWQIRDNLSDGVYRGHRPDSQLQL